MGTYPPGTTRVRGALRVPANYNLGRVPAVPTVIDPKAQREDELLERALTNSPDYTAAVRRAAAANVDAEQPAVGRQTAATAQAREQRISTEEARLSDAVEQRRRARLAHQAQDAQAARYEAAVAACNAQGSQIDASYYNRRSFLNLDGMVASTQARNACMEGYMRSGIVP